MELTAMGLYLFFTPTATRSIRLLLRHLLTNIVRRVCFGIWLGDPLSPSF
jgi:hypothetical protein